MYKIYADDTLIYDSKLEDYKLAKGSITLETNKSGSFVFSIYPDHFYYDRFVRLKTIITVYKSGRIVFRGRILNDVTDHWNNKVLTCEGELGFLQDSIYRPFDFRGDPFNLFTSLITNHNNQVDEAKRFKIGTQTLVDEHYNYIVCANENHDTTINNLNNYLISDTIARYFQITHGEDGTDPIPTINHIADFTKVSTQIIEFGSNLKNFTKTVKAEDIATAIIPIDKNKGTIESVNDGKDYIVNEEGVALYGLIYKVVTFEDANDPSDLLNKATKYLAELTKQNVTLELTAIDLHLLDHSIESFNVGDYIRIVSKPHNFDSVLLCNKQTIDLLKPDNDTITLGYTYATLSESSSKVSSSVNKTITTIQTSIKNVDTKVENLNSTVVSQNSTYDRQISLLTNNYHSLFQDFKTLKGGTPTSTIVQIEKDLTSALNALAVLSASYKNHLGTQTQTTTHKDIDAKLAEAEAKISELESTVNYLSEEIKRMLG